MEYTSVTNEDYLAYSGQDLNTELAALLVNCESNPAPRFIKGVEEWCMEYLRDNFSFVELETDYQVTQFKKGVIYQIDYVLQNSTISNDSGYNQSTGMIIDRRELDKISISSNALRVFRLGGLANRK